MTKVATLVGVSTKTVQRVKSELKNTNSNHLDKNYRQGVEEGIEEIRSREIRLKTAMWDLFENAIADVAEARSNVDHEKTTAQSLASLTKVAASLGTAYVDLVNALHAIDLVGEELEAAKTK